MGDFRSDQCVISTGAPQGCVLSPVLFCLYTNDCKISSDQCNIIKYADDTVLTGLLYNNDSSAFVSEVQKFVAWCKSNSLMLNINKTKELVFDFRKGNIVHDHVIIDGNVVERVESYKYLGTYIDNKLNWNVHTKAVKGKACQRLYFLRKLKQCRVNYTIMKLFYQSIIQSVITASIICVFGSMPKKYRAELERVRKLAERCIGSSLPSLSTIYEESLLKKMDVCVICQISFETDRDPDVTLREKGVQGKLSPACDDRGQDDEWGKQVKARFSLVSDLHAADAIYHQACSVNFRTHKQLPKSFQGNSKSKRTPGRPEDEHQAAAFITVAEYLKENDEVQATLTDLVEKMRESEPL
ncbi:hypothetical protein BSL78_07187 [Apostichopus japonicus]|uniref:Reverse transcriptase domain-containing protein n=1 Tax=Stichopus japonicus TaxID=307972 RepID=A0A2G8L6M5_STIJA|nr:hypothetical protein BSL78_07187 [Apostichopus japonicus]